MPTVMISPMVTFLENIRSCWIWRTCSIAEVFDPASDAEAIAWAYSVKLLFVASASAGVSGPKISSAVAKVAYGG